jgi:LacI family transcriptional regulator
LQHRGVPSVFLDLAAPKELISTIVVDYAVGVRQAVGYLLELGHRRIGLIAGPELLKSSRARRGAFFETLKTAGIEEDATLIANGGHTVLGGLAAMTQVLSLQSPPTAVLASNDLSAIGALRAAHKQGLKVPEDISIVGFDDILLAEFTDPPLTTIRLSRQDLARQALDALLRHIRNETEDSRQGREFTVSSQLVIRSSTSARL